MVHKMKINEELVRKNIQEFQKLAKDNPYFDADVSDMDKGDLFDNVVDTVINGGISKGKAVELLDVDYGEFYYYIIKKGLVE